VSLETDFGLADFRRKLKQIEQRLGRQFDHGSYARRTIDLDICLWDARVEHDPGHPVPDPDLLQRPYLATVGAEVAPDWHHPVTGEPLAAIAQRLAPGAQLATRPDLTATLLAFVSDPAAP
jgi:2-amino-4-hydroxy-6-hydroxymethyldihydropteridine diphosphokinase